MFLGYPAIENSPNLHADKPSFIYLQGTRLIDNTGLPLLRKNACLTSYYKVEFTTSGRANLENRKAYIECETTNIGEQLTKKIHPIVCPLFHFLTINVTSCFIPSRRRLPRELHAKPLPWAFLVSCRPGNLMEEMEEIVILPFCHRESSSPK